MFTQCPECKTIFGFNEEQTQVAGGQVRCSQCSHVFDAMAHSMEELPGTDEAQPGTETTPAPPPESNEVAEEPAVTEEPVVEKPSTDTDDDEAFSLFDDANDFMEAISDDFERPEPAVEENIVFNELDTPKTHEETEATPEPEVEAVVSAEPAPEETEDPVEEEPVETPEETENPAEEEPVKTPEATEDPAEEEPVETPEETEDPVEEEPIEIPEETNSSTVPETTPETEIETEATASTEAPEAEPTETSAETTTEEDEADNLADEWASMLGEEENTETTPEIETTEAEETESLVEEDITETTEAEEETTAEDSVSTETTETSEPTEEEEEFDEKSSLQDFLQSQLEDLDDTSGTEAEALDISLDSLADKPDDKPAKQKQVEQPVAQSEDETPDLLIEDIIPSEDKIPAWGINLVWIAGILISLVLLTSQYIYTMRNDLSQIPSARPWVIKFCEMTECEVPLYSDLTQLEFVSQDVRSHPRYQNALMVTIVLINRSPFYQAYPVIEFQLSDINQNPVAGRYFLPNAYLDASVDIEEGIKPDTPIRAVIEINDPGELAINYDFDFK